MNRIYLKSFISAFKAALCALALGGPLYAMDHRDSTFGTTVATVPPLIMHTTNPQPTVIAPAPALTAAPAPITMQTDASITPQQVRVRGYITPWQRPRNINPTPILLTAEQAQEQDNRIEGINFVGDRRCRHSILGGISLTYPLVVCVAKSTFVTTPVMAPLLACAACELSSLDCLPGKELFSSKLHRVKEVDNLGRYLSLRKLHDQASTTLYTYRSHDFHGHAERLSRRPEFMNATEDLYTTLPEKLQVNYATQLRNEQEHPRSPSCGQRINDTAYACMAHPCNCVCSWFCCARAPEITKTIEEITELSKKIVRTVHVEQRLQQYIAARANNR